MLRVQQGKGRGRRINLFTRPTRGLYAKKKKRSHAIILNIMFTQLSNKTTAIPLPIKLYMALRVGVAVILSQRPTPGTREYSTIRFCGETTFWRVFWKFKTSSFVLVKKASLWVKNGKLTKRRRSVKPTCANGGTNRANGGTNASYCTSGGFQFFLARGQICFDFDSATVKREKKEKKTKEKKHCGQRQREKISLIFRRASSLEKEIDDCLHPVRRISHAVDVPVLV